MGKQEKFNLDNVFRFVGETLLKTTKVLKHETSKGIYEK